MSSSEEILITVGVGFTITAAGSFSTDGVIGVDAEDFGGVGSKPNTKKGYIEKKIYYRFKYKNDVLKYTEF